MSPVCTQHRYPVWFGVMCFLAFAWYFWYSTVSGAQWHADWPLASTNQIKRVYYTNLVNAVWERQDVLGRDRTEWVTSQVTQTGLVSQVVTNTFGTNSVVSTNFFPGLATNSVTNVISQIPSADLLYGIDLSILKMLGQDWNNRRSRFIPPWWIERSTNQYAAGSLFQKYYSRPTFDTNQNNRLPHSVADWWWNLEFPVYGPVSTATTGYARNAPFYKGGIGEVESGAVGWDFYEEDSNSLYVLIESYAHSNATLGARWTDDATTNQLIRPTASGGPRGHWFLAPPKASAINFGTTEFIFYPKFSVTSGPIIVYSENGSPTNPSSPFDISVVGWFYDTNLTDSDTGYYDYRKGIDYTFPGTRNGTTNTITINQATTETDVACGFISEIQWSNAPPYVATGATLTGASHLSIRYDGTYPRFHQLAGYGVAPDETPDLIQGTGSVEAENAIAFPELFSQSDNTLDRYIRAEDLNYRYKLLDAMRYTGLDYIRMSTATSFTNTLSGYTVTVSVVTQKVEATSNTWANAKAAVDSAWASASPSSPGAGVTFVYYGSQGINDSGEYTASKEAFIVTGRVYYAGSALSYSNDAFFSTAVDARAAGPFTNFGMIVTNGFHTVVPLGVSRSNTGAYAEFVFPTNSIIDPAWVGEPSAGTTTNNGFLWNRGSFGDPDYDQLVIHVTFDWSISNGLQYLSTNTYDTRRALPGDWDPFDPSF